LVILSILVFRRVYKSHKDTPNVYRLKMENLPAWWYTAIFLELGKQKQEDSKFKASPGYIARSCFKKKGRKERSEGGREERKEGKKGRNEEKGKRKEQRRERGRKRKGRRKGGREGERVH
jgi:hypothetical protein